MKSINLRREQAFERPRYGVRSSARTSRTYCTTYLKLVLRSLRSKALAKPSSSLLTVGNVDSYLSQAQTRNIRYILSQVLLLSASIKFRSSSSCSIITRHRCTVVGSGYLTRLQAVVTRTMLSVAKIIGVDSPMIKARAIRSKNSKTRASHSGSTDSDSSCVLNR